MTRLLDDPAFAAHHAELARIGLDPRRHTTPDRRTHAAAVAGRAVALAAASGCTAAEQTLLEAVGHAHDLGLVPGGPTASHDRLVALGVSDPALLGLVRWHGTSLAWWLAAQRAAAPSEATWRRLVDEVDLRLLVLFMVADRVDAPGGWRRNAPLVWFVGEARRHGLLPPALVLDLPGVPSEISAGAVLVDGRRALVIRTRAHGYELPKGGIEWGELPEDAALRELREETGVDGDFVVSGRLGELAYDYRERDETWHKRVHVFAARALGPLDEGARPKGTRERRWLGADEVATVALRDEDVRAMLRAALA